MLNPFGRSNASSSSSSSSSSNAGNNYSNVNSTNSTNNNNNNNNIASASSMHSQSSRLPHQQRKLPKSSRGSSSNKAETGNNAGDLQRDDDELLLRVASAPELNAKSRKGEINVTHLLNFSLTKREKVDQLPPKRKSQHHRQQTIFNKELFLQANYRFLVGEGKDYEVYLAVADQMFDWDDIRQVIVSTTSAYCCPICLYPPIAPKITRCGHVFCWCCLLRMFGQAGKAWGSCPTCKEIVAANDLKPAIIEITASLKENDIANFTLLRRERGSVIPTLCSRNILSRMECPKMTDDNAPFAKFSTISHSQYLKQVIGRELDELQNALAEAKSSHDEEIYPFLDLAIATNQKRHEESVDAEFDPKFPGPEGRNADARSYALVADDCDYTGKIPPVTFSNVSGPSEAELELEFPALATANISKSQDDGKTPKSLNASALEFVPGTNSNNTNTNNTNTNNTNTKRNNNSNNNKDTSSTSAAAASRAISHENVPNAREDGFLYFYQLCDGQRVFLHPLNYRMLVAAQTSTLPTLISGKILELERHSQSEESRKRLRALDHLPLICEFTLVEIDMQQLVPAAIMQQFDEEIRRRSNRRKQKAKQDKIDAKKMERMSTLALRALLPPAAADPPPEYYQRGPVVGQQQQQQQLVEDAPTELAHSNDSNPYISFARVVNDGFGALSPAVTTWNTSTVTSTGSNPSSVWAGGAGTKTSPPLSSQQQQQQQQLGGEDISGPHPFKQDWAAAQPPNSSQKKKKNNRGTLLVSNSFSGRT